MGYKLIILVDNFKNNPAIKKHFIHYVKFVNFPHTLSVYSVSLVLHTKIKLGTKLYKPESLKCYVSPGFHYKIEGDVVSLPTIQQSQIKWSY